MQFITALRDACFTNPVYGPGVLQQGRTYYTFGQFAREAAGQGLARILDQAPLKIVRFLPSHLDTPAMPRRILLMFAGGLGDAVTMGIVLPLAMDRFGFEIDICCDKSKWDAIFHPMALEGRHIPFPPDLDALARYEAVLCDITDFFPDPHGLKVSPVLQLLQGFQLPNQNGRARYRVPPGIMDRMRLPPPDRKRIGLNLDSKGLVKSYPLQLHEALFKALLSGDLEIHILGNRGSSYDLGSYDCLFDWRDKTTIPELSALLVQMDLALGVDSFMVHLSNLLSIPTLVLLATTTPPYFAWHKYITCLQSKMECSPCYAFQDQCPRGYPSCKAFEHAGISPAVISRRVQELLIS